MFLLVISFLHTCWKIQKNTDNIWPSLATILNIHRIIQPSFLILGLQKLVHRVMRPTCQLEWWAPMDMLPRNT